MRKKLCFAQKILHKTLALHAEKCANKYFAQKLYKFCAKNIFCGKPYLNVSKSVGLQKKIPEKVSNDFIWVPYEIWMSATKSGVSMKSWDSPIVICGSPMKSWGSSMKSWGSLKNGCNVQSLPG